jgi:hypothetical protein
MPINVAIAGDVAASTIEKFLNPKNPKDIFQHVQDKPLLVALYKSKAEFGAAGPNASQGGQPPANFREPVQGALMRDKPGFYVGIQGSNTLSFSISDGAIQTTCPVRWMHAGFEITHQELAFQGVAVTNNKSAVSTEQEDNCLFDALKVKKADYAESIEFGRNQTLWLDGTQDALAIPGIKSILVDDPTAAGNTLGINRANVWWRHRARTGVGGALPKLSYSKSDQTMTETLDYDYIQLCRYGGRPDVWFAGSDFIDALKREARAKGMITMDGWEDGDTNIFVTGIKIDKYKIAYDPTLDLIGEAKRCYAWDSRKLKLRPQKNQWGKVTNQNQPYDAFVMLLSTTDMGVLSCCQMDCNYVAEMN